MVTIFSSRKLDHGSLAVLFWPYSQVPEGIPEKFSQVTGYDPDCVKTLKSI